MNCFLTSASFEERSLALVTDLADASDDDVVILLDFAGYEDVAPYLFNRFEIIRQLAKKKYKTMTVSVRLGGPLDAMRQIESIVEKADDVLLDISTLPRHYLFEICNLLAKLEMPTRVRYYRPVEYGSELSRGVASIRSIPGFEGMHLPYGNVVLAVILGFEGYKATFAWEAIGPSRVIAFIGDPPYEPAFLGVSRENNKDLLALVEVQDVYSLDTLDPVKAQQQLCDVYTSLKGPSDASFVLCPLGTKPQSLASFGFAFTRPEVSVAYVSSLTYFTERYSRGFRPDFLELELSSLFTNNGSSH